MQDLDNRCIADFVELFQGEIPEKGSFYLTKGTQKSEKNRDIAVIQELPTETMLFPHMSYFDNLCFTMDHRIRGVWNQSGIRRSIQEEQKDLLGEDVFDTPVWNLTRQQKYDLVYAQSYLGADGTVFEKKYCSGDPGGESCRFSGSG